MLTKQEIYDRSVAGLASQGFRKSEARAANICLYRSKKDNEVLKCAIGWLIPDEKYTLGMDNLYDAAGCVNFENILKVCNIENKYEYFCLGLRNCHDESSSPKEMVENLINFGPSNGLTIPKVLTEYKG